MAQKGDERTVPGTGGPGPNEASVEGQRALRLHAGIAALALVLTVFVTWIFVRLGSIPLAVVFGAVAVISLLILGWALYRKRRGEQHRYGASRRADPYPHNQVDNYTVG